MSNVYFIPAGGCVKEASVRLLQTVLDRDNVELASRIPLKVHFGEKGNKTYLKSETYDGLIDFLQSKGVDCRVSETSVLY